mmetsp:Transcript_29191/g.67686  ORF Transcript_29191/g.67686 Transcript_29191/m.67686 type:complete len:173 (-) Transcript_29191:93-611(-)
MAGSLWETNLQLMKTPWILIHLTRTHKTTAMTMKMKMVPLTLGGLGGDTEDVATEQAVTGTTTGTTIRTGATTPIGITILMHIITLGILIMGPEVVVVAGTMVVVVVEDTMVVGVADTMVAGVVHHRSLPSGTKQISKIKVPKTSTMFGRELRMLHLETSQVHRNDEKLYVP